jgi:hypothetical protein
MRHLTDVEIEARIATRMATLTTRVRRLELTVRALLTAAESLAQEMPHRVIIPQILDEARKLLDKGGTA